MCLYDLESFQAYLDHAEMHEILQTHLLRAFVANLKIDTIYALYLESFCDKNLAIRKVFAFSDSGVGFKHLNNE